MNPLYEKLILAFFEKVQIKHDGVSVHIELKKKYPKSNLPNPRTFQRFLDAETHNPRDSVLGYMSAYLLDLNPKEVELAEMENNLGDFFTSFLENPKPQPKRKKNSAFQIQLPHFSIRTMSKSVIQKVIKPKKRILFLLYIASLIAVVMLVYILFMSFK